MTLAPENHSGHNDSHHSHHYLKWLAVGTALTAGAVIIAPYVLPLIGIGEGKDIVNIMSSLHNSPAVAGEGLAGLINEGLSKISPVLAEGSLKTALISGGIGIGGMILGHYVGKKEDGSHFIKWGKVIKTSALIASALIALPTMLTGITAGLTFLASQVDNGLASSALTFLRKTVGYANSESLAAASFSTASIALPHLLTCGAGMLPACFTFCMPDKKTQNESQRENDAPLLAVPAAPAATHNHTPVANDGPDAINASVRLEKPTTAGEEAKGVLVLKHAATGAPLALNELKESNEAIIHFFINNSSLTDYHHIHPKATETPGEYTFSFTPKTSQPYTGFPTIVTLPDGKHRELKVSFPPAINRYVAPNVRMNSQVDTGGLSFDWKMDGPMQKGKPSNIEVTIKDARGIPVTDLQPVYGEWSHLEGFSASHGTMLHTHPKGREPTGKDDRMSSPLHFVITPKDDGPTQFYVQVKRGDKDIYAPIGQYVKGPEKRTDRIMMSGVSGDRGIGVAASYSYSR